MTFNKAKAEKQWLKWKETEEEKLRQLGMDEESIRKLRQMDWEDFKEEHRYWEHFVESRGEATGEKRSFLIKTLIEGKECGNEIR